MKNAYPTAGEYGTPQSSCDSPVKLLNLASSFIEDTLRPAGFDFVIWTGDTAR
jgi:hypothetical protein